MDRDPLFFVRQALPNTNDAFFSLDGKKRQNILLTDINRDDHPEIITATFDSKLAPHVHIFQFNESVGQLEPLNGDDLDIEF